MVKKILLSLLAIFIIAIAAAMIIGPQTLMINAFKPSHDFSENRLIDAPDYSDQSNWAALPTKKDLADLRPEGVLADTILKDINVFYIHPTGYLKGKEWNSSMDITSATEENTKWMMANQASCFSDGRVYAPRYREATIYSFFELEEEGSNGHKALDLAYEDVKRAFLHFIENYNGTAPFVLASHSQGSYHGIRLLLEEIDKGPLAEQLIAAYLIGMGTIDNATANQLQNIKVCNSPNETNCFVHWATFAETAPFDELTPRSMVCVNPLNWKRDGSMASKEMNHGMVEQSGQYTLKFYGDDEKYDTIEFGPLPAPEQKHTFAYCKEGRLLVEVQEGENDFLGEGNYHGLDYQLFHMNIRKNVADRVRSFKARRVAL